MLRLVWPPTGRDGPSCSADAAGARDVAEGWHGNVGLASTLVYSCGVLKDAAVLGGILGQPCMLFQGSLFLALVMCMLPSLFCLL